MRDLVILIAATFALMGSVPATAQTPDGETPAVEEVCDTLIGATPGLYGLCVAYCEAHDADLLSEPDVPNRNILRNYNTKKTKFDPPMPCAQIEEVDDCVCWTADELLMVFPPKTNFDVNKPHACENSDNLAVLENLENVDVVTGRAVPPLIQLATGINSDATFCLVVNMDYLNAVNPRGPSRSDIVIETEEFQSCKALLAARANTAMTMGVVWDCFAE